MDKVNLEAKLGGLREPWVPKIVAELNGQCVKVLKCEGEYPWHRHEQEDELFLVVDGQLDVRMRDRVVHLQPGELFVVPRGVEHSPATSTTACVVLIEPATTRNTGDIDHEYTIEPQDLERI